MRGRLRRFEEQESLSTRGDVRDTMRLARPSPLGARIFLASDSLFLMTNSSSSRWPSGEAVEHCSAGDSEVEHWRKCDGVVNFQLTEELGLCFPKLNNS